MNSQDDIPSIFIEKLKDHHVIMFDLILLQDATENCHYSELVEKLQKSKLNFTYPQEHITEHFAMGEQLFSVANDKFANVGKKIWNRLDNVAVQQIIFWPPVIKTRLIRRFSSNYVPLLHNETLAVKYTQPNNVQGGHWIMFENACYKVFFADPLGGKNYNFLKQHYKQNLPEPLQSQPSVCGFYARFMQFYISSSFDSKKLPEFRMVMNSNF